MKKNNKTIIMILFFFVGLLVLLYPSISDFYNQKRQSKVIVDYESLLEKYSQTDYTQLFDEADKYNKELASLKYPTSPLPRTLRTFTQRSFSANSSKIFSESEVWRTAYIFMQVSLIYVYKYIR